MAVIAYIRIPTVSLQSLHHTTLDSGKNQRLLELQAWPFQTMTFRTGLFLNNHRTYLLALSGSAVSRYLTFNHSDWVIPDSMNQSEPELGGVFSNWPKNNPIPDVIAWNGQTCSSRICSKNRC